MNKLNEKGVNMKKILTSVLTLGMAAASLPVTALAADNSDPVTKSGERLKYNTPYYLKDKNLLDNGGVTVEPRKPLLEPWTPYDYVRFSDSSTDNGAPIIFENQDRTDGFIGSDDKISIKSTKTNWEGCKYWTLGENSVYLSNDDKADHRIYGSSEDTSIGIGILDLPTFIPERFGTGHMTWDFVEYKGDSWMKPYRTGMRSPKLPPLNDRQTPFEVIEVSE
ncbi:Kunitz family serine protease inhibitor [Bacillus sp. C30]|uniref:Kunitz family serine protease inhibitor n=1 Tax=Bacillus sp. C30 TaxID=1387733 RepID=UPI00349FBEC3